MSTNITEEASKLRAAAASTVIQNSLDLEQLARRHQKFNFSSNSSDELYEKELKIILHVREKTETLIQELIQGTQSVCSAVTASSASSLNILDKITIVIQSLDKANGTLSEVQDDFTAFREVSGLQNQKVALESIHRKIGNIIVHCRTITDQLQALLFGR